MILFHRKRKSPKPRKKEEEGVAYQFPLKFFVGERELIIALGNTSQRIARHLKNQRMAATSGRPKKDFTHYKRAPLLE